MGEDPSYEFVRRRRSGPLHLLALVGTRPEAVKLAPIARAARRCADIEFRLVGSGQHPAAMLEVLDHFGLRLDGELAGFEDGLTLSRITTAALDRFAGELAEYEPDVVLVQGDTTTAFAGALGAFYSMTPVGHVEAGLRTYDRLRPFPEEMNRRLIDTLASYLFPPTDVAAANLAAEGLLGDGVFLTGNTIVDSLRWTVDGNGTPPNGDARAFADQRWENRVLVTAHRRESWGVGLDEIASGVLDVARRFGSTLFLLPLHPNPIVRRSFAGRRAPSNMMLVEPLPYSSFISALAQADVVLTDSGGVLEEATVLGTSALILRHVTERPEAVAAGVARVVGVERRAIATAAADALLDAQAGIRPRPQQVFGDGHAGERTIEWLRWRYGLSGDGPEPFTCPTVDAASGEIVTSPNLATASSS